jgi:hypothetical protein
MILQLLLKTCYTWQCVVGVSADHYKVPHLLLYKLVVVESTGCKYIYNRRSKDYGCLQVNRVHLKHSIDMQRFSDYRYSIPAGAAILAKAKSACAYHLGKAGVKRHAAACQRYKRKVALAWKR